jgi:hypothetical protein
MEKAEYSSPEDVDALEEARRRAAEKVRRSLADLEAAEREFATVTEKLAGLRRAGRS